MAWLTRWVYSWDVLEPVTNLITFASFMVLFANVVVTRQDHAYQLLRVDSFHKKSQQRRFDAVQYKLKDPARATEPLKRVRHALRL